MRRMTSSHRPAPVGAGRGTGTPLDAAAYHAGLYQINGSRCAGRMRFLFVMAALMLSLFQPLSASAQDAGPRCGPPPVAKATPTALAALSEHGHVRTDE